MRYTVPPLARLIFCSVEIPCLVKGLDLPCWVPTRKPDHYGYSRIKIEGKYVRAHRFAYRELRGEIPAGLILDHLCRNRACWNPWHVEPVTDLINCHRGRTGMKSGRRLSIMPVKILEKL